MVNCFSIGSGHLAGGLYGLCHPNQVHQKYTRLDERIRGVAAQTKKPLAIGGVKAARWQLNFLQATVPTWVARHSRFPAYHSNRRSGDN